MHTLALPILDLIRTLSAVLLRVPELAQMILSAHAKIHIRSTLDSYDNNAKSLIFDTHEVLVQGDETDTRRYR